MRRSEPTDSAGFHGSGAVLAARCWSAAIFTLCCTCSAGGCGAAAHGEGNMHFDLAAIPASDAYKLLVSTVVPRPIALATTVDADGRVNAAPFSFFNAVSSVPPVVVLGVSPGDSAGDGYKDTERNIRDSGEFVVNLVDEAIAERMNVCAVDFPSAIGELDMAGLTPVASVGIRPPRIAESPVSFECKRI